MPAHRPLSPARLLVPTLALALLVCGVSAAGASAAIPWASCTPAGYQCARVDVPLDRAGTVPGTISLNLKRVPAASNPSNEAVVVLAGGPGQAAVPLTEQSASELKPAIATRDLLVFDQRGTGQSGALTCNALNDFSLSQAAASAGCATQLGAGRAFYRTSDSVADIEALRVAGGYSKLVLYGVSYGTKVAEDYAAQYPQNVSSLVLDSVVPPDGPDPFSRSTLNAMPRVLKEQCANGGCSGATDNVTRDLNALVRRLKRGRLSAKAVTPGGVKARLHDGIQLGDLVAVLYAGDLNPLLRVELPGSMRAALQGDTMPLARLVVRSEGLTAGYSGSRARAASLSPVARQTADDDISQALYYATTCEETAFPWTRAASASQRTQEIVAAVNALPKSAFGPFGPTAALKASGAVQSCVGWPDASPAPTPTPAITGVRTLILDGQMDVRTPLEDARAVGGSIPGAQVVEVPWTGHSTVVADASDNGKCTQDALTAFFAGGNAAPCAAGENPYPASPKPPKSYKSIHIASSTKKAIAVAKATINDAYRQIVGDVFAFNAVPSHVGGLRAGNASVSKTGAFTLHKYQYVPGVVVSGSVSSKVIANVTIHGGGAPSGRLRISRTGTVTGTLGGRKVNIGASSSLVAGELPTVAEALASARAVGR